MDTLSIQQARKLVLLAQRLPPAKASGSPLAATLSAIEHLGYIQIDTISAIQRAHHHTLWNRNPRYQSAQLEQLLSEQAVFEYWSHAAAYLPIADYRFTLPRKQAIASGQLKHWYEHDKPLMKSILQRISSEGPLMAKDFEHHGAKLKEWGSKPAKRALENLFMQGELMIPKRVNFHKVYDLTERVLPANIDTRMPEPWEYTRFQIIRYLQANGLGQAAEIAYLLKNRKPAIAETLQEMLLSQEVRQFSVAGHHYFALPTAGDLLNGKLARNTLKILSPFDNLLIQRKRTQALFNFSYTIECYLPAGKRQYGYFCLPILWDGKLVARMDCKVDRSTAVLHIYHLAVEPWLVKTDAFNLAFTKELAAFLAFNYCVEWQLHRTTPSSFKAELHALTGL